MNSESIDLSVTEFQVSSPHFMVFSHYLYCILQKNILFMCLCDKISAVSFYKWTNNFTLLTFLPHTVFLKLYFSFQMKLMFNIIISYIYCVCDVRLPSFIIFNYLSLKICIPWKLFWVKIHEIKTNLRSTVLSSVLVKVWHWGNKILLQIKNCQLKKIYQNLTW